VGTRKYFAILLAKISKGRPFKSRSHYDLRRRGGNKIYQQERDDAHYNNNRSKSFEQLPTAETQHEYLPSSSSRGGKTAASSPYGPHRKSVKFAIMLANVAGGCVQAKSQRIPLADLRQDYSGFLLTRKGRNLVVLT
jgi:hypothetical protein